MKNHEFKQSGSSLAGFKRKAISFSEQELVKTERLGNSSLPLLIRPTVEGLDPWNWAVANRDFLREKLLQHGGLLLRDFGLADTAGFERFMRIACGELLEYRERSSPRNRVEGNIYTSTEYPANQSIFLHNENSYQKSFPLKIGFFCVVPPSHGGETPIADVRKVFHRVPAAIGDKFATKKVMYVRNFGSGFGLPWQTVFQTQDKAEVERYCAQAGLHVEWKENDGLRTKQVRPAVARHPQSGEMVWFNHATFFHVSTLPSSIRESLLREFKEEDLPVNTYYGDGSSIEESTLDELRGIYADETVTFQWQRGDLLMLENMLVAHGRAPFEGERRIVVGMAEPCCLENV
jgi:alpha-ketoglutarate-dependent taurine dioxygenase